MEASKDTDLQKGNVDLKESQKHLETDQDVFDEKERLLTENQQNTMEDMQPLGPVVDYSYIDSHCKHQENFDGSQFTKNTVAMRQVNRYGRRNRNKASMTVSYFNLFQTLQNYIIKN